MADDTLAKNAKVHYNSPHTQGEWALSVASLPAASADEIVTAATTITQREYRAATAADLTAAGFLVLKDASPVNPSHALIMLAQKPDESTWADLRSVFTTVGLNKHYEERRRRGGRR